MNVIEQFTLSKTGDNSQNEDNIITTPDYFGVLDGATSYAGFKMKGLPNGRFASQTLGDAIKGLPADIGAVDAVRSLTKTFRTVVEKAAQEEGIDLSKAESWPFSAMLLYSRARQEVWRLGDSLFSIDGTVNQPSFPQEDIWIAMRQVAVAAETARGVTLQQMLDKDPAAEAMKAVVVQSASLTNYEGPYGFGMVNGSHVPEKFIEVFPAKNAKEIIFASDGYVALFNTLAQTEAHIQKTLSEDPLMIRDYPQVKGRKTGWVSYDDRSYLRFKP
jgi:hypothetical protein